MKQFVGEKQGWAAATYSAFLVSIAVLSSCTFSADTGASGEEKQQTSALIGTQSEQSRTSSTEVRLAGMSRALLS
jgi:hypothetical protein